MTEETIARDIGPKLADTSKQPFRFYACEKLNWKSAPPIETRLRELHAEKPQLSFSEITAIINSEFGTSLTRNSIIGKCSRMKLEKRGGHSNGGGKGHRSKGHRSKRPKHATNLPNFLNKRESQEEFTPRANDVKPLNIPLLKLETHHCRFPYGEDPKTMTYCGHPTAHEGCSWCPSHLAYVSAPKPRRITTEEQREAKAAAMRRYRAGRKAAA